MRKFISVLIALVLLALTIFLANKLRNIQKPEEAPPVKVIKSALFSVVNNQDLPIIVSSNATLKAKNRVDLYSEVQGVFKVGTNEFKPGVKYRKGQPLLRIDSQEHLATLRSQRSSFFNQLTSIMPDLKLDYPEAAVYWDAYLKNFDINSTLQPLPEPTGDSEKYFLSGRNIYSTFYNIKNLEVRLTKYTIKAPFNGVLTEALVTPGTLIRQGQKLGSFIETSVYEMEISVNEAYASLLETGKSVKVMDIDKRNSWDGKVVRINSIVDSNSQTVKAYVDVKGEGLREGMYALVEIQGKDEPNVYEISRKLLVDENKLFVIEGDRLHLKTIEPVYFMEKTVLVRGLDEGEKVLVRSIPSSYSGMEIKPQKSK